MALASSYVAETTQISFHRFIIPLGWAYVDNVIRSRPGDVVVEVRTSIP